MMILISYLYQHPYNNACPNKRNIRTDGQCLFRVHQTPTFSTIIVLWALSGLSEPQIRFNIYMYSFDQISQTFQVH